jgi:molybdopterin molybdotransferase
VISFDQALTIVTAQAQPLGAESVALDAAAGRVLAAPVVSQVNAPFADVSTMDGYAVRDADLRSTATFPVIGTAYPGVPFSGAIEAPACVRIFTGAVVPAGADRVIVQENVRRDGETAIVGTPPSANRYIRAAGADFRAGDMLFDAGRLIDPRTLVAVAGGDVGAVDVWRRPRVTVISTGDELASPGEARHMAHRIPESVSFGITALAQEWGAELVERCRVRDDLDVMQARAHRALDESDLVVMIGGASVGEKDFAKRAFDSSGADILFSRVAIMPGKPVWLARAGERLVLGLPGNPTSAMVTARLFLAPLLAGMGGRDPGVATQWQSVVLAEALPAAGDRETFVRGTRDADGVRALPHQDSGMQLALARADLLIRRTPHAPAAGAGVMVGVLPF